MTPRDLSRMSAIADNAAFLANVTGLHVAVPVDETGATLGLVAWGEPAAPELRAELREAGLPQTFWIEAHISHNPGIR